MEKIGKTIKKKRLEMGLSQGAVASLAGITMRTEQNIEYGEACTVSCLSSVCDVLGLEIVIKEKKKIKWV